MEGPKNIPPLSSFKPMTLDYSKAADRVEDVTSACNRYSGYRKLETFSVKSRAIRPSRALPSARAFTLGLAVTLFVLFCVLPVVYMFIVSLTGAAGSFTLDNYRELLTDPRQRGLMLTSVVLGGGAAIFATVLGAPLGLLFARARLPAKRFLRLALIVPLVVPPYVLALAWVLVTGPGGLFARAGGRDFLSEWTYSLTGAVVVLGLAFYPLSMLATEAAARRVDARLEESALLAANPRRVLWRITLPLIGPTVATAGLIVFVLALSEFGVPALLRVRVFTTEAFTAFAAFYDFGAGVALCAPLLVVALIVSLVIKFIIGERLLVTTRSLQLGLPLTFSRPFRTAILIGIAIVISASTLLPLAALLTTLYVTHDKLEAATFADSVVKMKNGRIDESSLTLMQGVR